MQLRNLSLLARAGVVGLVLVIWMGQAASLMHVYWHYEPRDERPGFTLDDLRSAYHGLQAKAPLALALERNHPAELGSPLDAATRTQLQTWLASDAIAENYDNLDQGDSTPAELIATNCVRCHTRKATPSSTASTLMLDTWEDVRKVAFSRSIKPVPIKILAISTHTHALALASLSGIAFVLALGTRWATLASVLVAVNGLALAGDIAGWWLARVHADVVFLIVAAGGLYNASLTLMTLLALGEMLLPRRSASAS